jgi:hypothetical protein
MTRCIRAVGTDECVELGRPWLLRCVLSIGGVSCGGMFGVSAMDELRFRWRSLGMRGWGQGHRSRESSAAHLPPTVTEPPRDLSGGPASWSTVDKDIPPRVSAPRQSRFVATPS